MLTRRHEKEECRQVYIHDGTAAYYWYFPKKILQKTVMVEFEKELFPIPQRFEEFLSTAYGNYMELPPKEKRKTHNIIELDFGEYK